MKLRKLRANRFFIITPIPLPIENSNPSNSSCTDGLNTLQDQPQVFSAPPEGSLSAGETSGSSIAASPLSTITVSEGVSFTFPTTITVTPTQTPTTVVVVSESVTTIVTTDNRQSTVTMT